MHAKIVPEGVRLKPFQFFLTPTPELASAIDAVETMVEKCPMKIQYYLIPYSFVQYSLLLYGVTVSVRVVNLSVFSLICASASATFKSKVSFLHTLRELI